MHDHVHINAGLCQRRKNLMGNARRIRDAKDSDLRHLLIVCHASDLKVFFFHCVILPNDRTRLRRKGRAHMNGNLEQLAHLHRARLHDACAQTSHFQHLEISDFLHLARALRHAGICGVDAVHVRKDLTGIRLQRACQCHGRGIRASAPKRHRISCGIHALETGHDHDIALVQLLLHTLRLDVNDTSLRMHRIRLHADHRACQRNRRLPQRLERHGQKRNGNLLAGGQKHIHLAGIPVGFLRDPLRQLDEFICGIPHRGYHHHNLIARFFFIQHTLCDCHDLFRRRHRAAAKFLYNQSQPRSPPMKDLLANPKNQNIHHTETSVIRKCRMRVYYN